MLELSVVMPAYNEEAYLRVAVETVCKELTYRGLRFEILLVENGSTDGTGRLAGELQQCYQEVSVQSLLRGDYGAALRAGCLAAKGDIIVCFDVDYVDVDFLDSALEILRAEETALVVASKCTPGAQDRRPWYRRTLTAGLSLILVRLFRMRVSDAHGVKAFKREPLSTIINECQMTRSLFDVEMVIRAGKRGLKLAEIPASVAEQRPARTSAYRRLAEVCVGLARLAWILRGA